MQACDIMSLILNSQDSCTVGSNVLVELVRGEAVMYLLVVYKWQNTHDTGSYYLKTFALDRARPQLYLVQWRGVR